MTELLEHFRESSALYGSNATFIEDLYERFMENPESVEISWQQHFKKLQQNANFETPHSPIVKRFEELAVKSHNRLAELQGFTEESVKKQSAVARLCP